MKKKKIITIVSIAAALAILTASSFALDDPYTSGKPVNSEIIDRVNYSVSATEFTFKDGGKDKYTCEFTFSIKKTQPDFYAELNAAELSGAEFPDVIYTAGKDNPESARIPENASITYENPLSWEIKFTVPKEEGKNVYQLNFTIDFVSGVKRSASDRHVVEIPIVVSAGQA